VEVFPGNTGDPATVAVQVHKLTARFGIEHVARVGDRGMITSARRRVSRAGACVASLTVAKALRSEHAREKNRTKRADDGTPLQTKTFKAAARECRLYPATHFGIDQQTPPYQRVAISLCSKFGLIATP